MSRIRKLDAIVEYHGGCVVFAKRIGVSKGAISQWLTKGQIPAWQAKNVSKITGIAIEYLPIHWAPTPEKARDIPIAA